MRLIEFTTPTCASCKEQKKVLDKYQITHKDVKVEVVDLFATPDAQVLFAQCHSSSFPTLAILDKAGTKVIYAEGGLHSVVQVEALVERARMVNGGVL
jgi:glutaredoxin